MTDQSARKKAAARVQAKLSFYIHLAVYLAVGTGLVVINLARSPDYIWFIWPLLGWGIGVAFHFLGVFVFSNLSGVSERMVEKELEKEGSKAH